ncbi:MAG TPA: amidohydrolase family protein [Thermoanaerobaculia bacterium]|nr:amidohydrolase family protein [Thermoanaerobaculia bacterium]
MRRVLAGAAFILIFLLAAGVLAAEPARVTLALSGGRVIDGYEGKPIEDAVVLIAGDRIAAVGPRSQVVVPPGTPTIDTRGMSVLPGLADMHVHLMIVGHGDYEHWDKTYRSRFRAEIMPAAAKQLLVSGVTFARELGAPLEDILGVKRRIESGEIPGPRLFVTGPFIQHKPYSDYEKEFRWGVTGAADARAKVQKVVDAGVDLVKLIDQDQMTEEEVKAVVETAHKTGRQVVAHAHREEEIRIGLKYGVDSFEHTGLATEPGYPEDILQGMRKRNQTLGWCPTIEGLYLSEYTADVFPERLNDPRWQEGLAPDIVRDIRDSLRNIGGLPYFQLVRRRLPTLPNKFRQLRESGVTLLVGTDSGIPGNFHTDSTWRELATWVELGMTPMQAIAGATRWPAVWLKREKDLGTLAPGRYADIIAVRGDVLRHIDLLQRVDIVIKNGVRVR